MKYNKKEKILMQLMNGVEEMLCNYAVLHGEILRGYEKILSQQQGYLFAENPITDFHFNGMNKHILISDNFETPNYEIVINTNGYISITDDASTVWYQVINESPVQLPYVRTVLDFDWNEFDMDSIINSVMSEVDLHRFMELLKVEVSNLKQRLWLLKNGTLKLEFIEDEKLIQKLVSLREVA